MSSKPPRTSSFQRLKERLTRHPSERVDPKDWPRPKDAQQVLKHALKDSLSNGPLFLRMVCVLVSTFVCIFYERYGGAPLASILAASFKNLDSLRFGAMFGTFAFLWKSINNGMRLYRGKDDRLNSLVGGAVAGLAILFEKRERRADIAQQMMVRAMQAIYNAGKARDIFYCKHGDALLFGLTCAQIMYAYTMQPHTLPPEFYAFMVKTARCPKEGLLLNAKNVRGLPISPKDALAAIEKYKPTPHAIKVAENILPFPTATPCETLHPWADSCNATMMERFLTVFRSMMPVYGALHFVPMLLLRTKHVKREPIKMLSKSLVGTLRSGAFLATFVSVYQYQMCGHRELIRRNLTSTNSKYMYYFAGLVSSFASIFIEDKKRRSELALYILPKAVQSFYEILYQRQWIIKIAHFEVAMTSLAMGILMSFYQEEPDVLSAFVRKIMFQFFRKN